MRKRISLGGTIFDNINIIFMFILMVTIVSPYIYIFLVSISNQTRLQHIFQKNTRISIESYKALFEAGSPVLRAFLVSVLRTVVGTTMNIIFTSLLAYPLSKKTLPGRNIMTFYIVITILFSGGLIPSYIVISSLGLVNKYLVYIIPTLISAWYTLLLRNFFMAIPDSLEDSAKMDGASALTILIRIVLPLSKPVLATLALFYAVGHWNAWFDGVVYIRNPNKYTLQVLLRRLIIVGSEQDLLNRMRDITRTEIIPESLKSATLLISVVPIVLIYPFLQRYFIKGIMIGAIKG